jgi:hypothetical protein
VAPALAPKSCPILVGVPAPHLGVPMALMVLAPALGCEGHPQPPAVFLLPPAQPSTTKCRSRSTAQSSRHYRTSRRSTSSWRVRSTAARRRRPNESKRAAKYYTVLAASTLHPGLSWCTFTSCTTPQTSCVSSHACTPPRLIVTHPQPLWLWSACLLATLANTSHIFCTSMSLLACGTVMTNVR